MELEKLNVVVALAVVLLALSRGGSAEKAQALFVFGDSNADTGNYNPYNSSVNGPWRTPSGFTWPGYAAGRDSSGKIQTDRWGEILGLPTPVAFELLKTHNCSEIPDKIEHGVNFAVGGAGVYEAFTSPENMIPAQVENCKWLINQTRVFGRRQLARSVVLLSNAGADYLYYAIKSSYNFTGLLSLVPTVVNGTVEVVKELYELGFRNFAVSDVNALGCLPAAGTSYDPSYDGIVRRHSRLLNESVEELRSSLAGVNITIPDMHAAFYYIFNHSSQYGFEEWFEPCCHGNASASGCTEVDERGEALFEVCDDPDTKFFWDALHPTHRGWHAVMSLYTNATGFVGGASNLIEWVQSLGFEAHDISPVHENHNFMLSDI